MVKLKRLLAARDSLRICDGCEVHHPLLLPLPYCLRCLSSSSTCRLTIWCHHYASLQHVAGFIFAVAPGELADAAAPGGPAKHTLGLSP